MLSVRRMDVPEKHFELDQPAWRCFGCDSPQQSDCASCSGDRRALLLLQRGFLSFPPPADEKAARFVVGYDCRLINVTKSILNSSLRVIQH